MDGLADKLPVAELADRQEVAEVADRQEVGETTEMSLIEMVVRMLGSSIGSECKGEITRNGLESVKEKNRQNK